MIRSDTSCEGVGGTLFEKQGDDWVVIGYHSKRLPASAKNFGVTELELTGLLVNIHGFMQLLRNRYFEVVVDHKAIEYMIKSKTETPTTRLKTLPLKLSKYTIDLKYQKGSEMHTSDTLSRLHNLTDTPNSKDIIPLNFLPHLTPNYIEHSYLHWTDILHVHKTKDYDMTQVKRKCGRPPKQKTKPDTSQTPAANTSTTWPKPTHKNSNTQIISRDLIKCIKHQHAFAMSITILQMENYHLVPKLKLVSRLKHLSMWLSTTFCLG